MDNKTVIDTIVKYSKDCIVMRFILSHLKKSLFLTKRLPIPFRLPSADSIKIVIDELDTRFMGSENAADLFGRILEPIMRTRIQNRMPLFFCTNSIKIEGSFSGPLQASIESLFNLVRFIPVIGGKDVRENIRKGEI